MALLALFLCPFPESPSGAPFPPAWPRLAVCDCEVVSNRSAACEITTALTKRTEMKRGLTDCLPSFPPSIVISLGRRMTKERQGNQNGRLFGRSAETDGDISEIPARLPVNNSSRQGLPDASDGRRLSTTTTMTPTKGLLIPISWQEEKFLLGSPLLSLSVSQSVCPL